MQIQKLECPHCGGSLDNVSLNQISYCPYCGKPVSVTDGDTTTINQNIRIQKSGRTEHTERVVDEAALLREKRLAREGKKDRRKFIVKLILTPIKWAIIGFTIISVVAIIVEFVL